MRSLIRRSPFGLAAAAVTALLVATAASGAAEPTVLLGLAGVHSKKARVCPKEKHPQLRPVSKVKRDVALRLMGSVKPAPTKAAWRASLVVKRCVSGRYDKVWTGQATGTRAGTFSAVYTPKLPGLYYALATYGKHPSTDSNKAYFTAS
jgi:hypothetical protein